MTIHTLIYDTDKKFLENISNTLSKFRCSFQPANNQETVFKKLKNEKIQVFIINVSKKNDREFLANIINTFPNTMIIAIVDNIEEIDKKEIVEVMKENKIFDFFFKPISPDNLIESLERACDTYLRKEKEENFLKNELSTYQDAANIFDWKSDLFSKMTFNISEDVIHQLNINFFQGGGIGTLIPIISTLLASSIEEEEDVKIEIPKNFYKILENSYNEILSMTKSFSDAQKLLMSDKECSDTLDILDLPSFLDEIKSEIKDYLAIKNQRFIISKPKFGRLSHKITFNKNKMRLVITELLINAMKYSKDDDVIYILLLVRLGYLEIKIINPAYRNEDQSFGIQGKNENLVFEPFYRLQPLIDERFNFEKFGHGLGLAIVKKIITLHKALISINNIKNYAFPDKSNEVCVTLRFPLL